MRRPLAIVLGIPPLLYACGALFFAWLTAVMQCDEICRTDTTDWRYTSGAWQWYAIGALGGVAFVAGIVFFACVISRRRWHGLASLGLLAGAVLLALEKFPVNPGSDQDLDFAATFWLATALVWASGVVAALLTDGQASQATQPALGLVARRVFAALAFLAAAYFLLGGVSTLFGGTVGVPTAPLLGRAAVFAFIGWGFWTGGFRARGRTG